MHGAVSGPIPTIGASRSRLGLLAGLAAILAAWLGNDAMQDRLAEQRASNQIKPVRAAPLLQADIAELKRRAESVSAQTKALRDSLTVHDAPALTEARVLQELRRSCAALAINGCTVKYAVINVGSASSPGREPRAKQPATFADLGLQRARVTIGGNFRDAEFTKLIAQLQSRRQLGLWRVNAINVRSTSFELEADLFYATKATPSGAGQ